MGMYISIIVVSLIAMVLTAMLMGVTPKKIKEIKELGNSKELNELTDALPENKEICKELLEKLNNKSVNIKTGGSASQASLYIVASNTILIANIKSTFTRVQTIAHECLHSVQDKKILWSNFILSNIYKIYFIVITILALINKLKYQNTFAVVLIIMATVLFFIRSYLEIDAMTKARFLAEDYMDGKEDMVTSEQVNVIVKNYDRLNDIGIKITVWGLLAEHLAKFIIFSLVAMF